MNALTSAVEAVICDPAGRVLLCQQAQGHRLWCLPGGRIRNAESPDRAVIRDIREETGLEIEVVDLVGLYHLTGDGGGCPLPDVLMYVFRAQAIHPEPTVNAPGRICRLMWASPDQLPWPTTATARAAIADAMAGRSGVLRSVTRDREPVIQEAVEAPIAL